MKMMKMMAMKIWENCDGGVKSDKKKTYVEQVTGKIKKTLF